MNDRQREILRHALGLAHSKTPYRQHFAASLGGADFPELRGLVDQGLMTSSLRPRPGETLVFFYVTPEGAAAVGERLPAD